MFASSELRIHDMMDTETTTMRYDDKRGTRTFHEVGIINSGSLKAGSIVDCATAVAMKAIEIEPVKLNQH